MEMKHIEGKNRGKILLYALSTCVWCKKTKRLLNNLGVAYDYVDVDLLDTEEKDKIKREIARWNPRTSFPTIVIDDNKCIVGFDEKKIKEEIGNE
ncbi:MAG: glutaredoxin family protein [candidate division WOR-3 bacterium]|nr:MAG: glutaredoxin family protein [candidate division WOR-3 bacterium]